MRTLQLMLLPVAALSILSATLHSCSSDHGDSSAFESIEGGDWAYGDTLWFTLATDSLHDGSKRLEVALRHTNEYPYSNIWLEIVADDKEGRIHTDTVNIELCDMFGRWYGKGFGDSYQITGSVATPITPDTLIHIGLRHIMRVDTLRGIDQAGVRFIPVSTPAADK